MATPMRRKTARVAEILSKANHALAAEPTEVLTRDFRRGVASLLENILQETGNYAGYMHLDPHTAGSDDSRREYYMHANLQPKAASPQDAALSTTLAEIPT